MSAHLSVHSCNPFSPTHDTVSDGKVVTDYSPEYLTERERAFNLIMQGGKIPWRYTLCGYDKGNQRYSNNAHNSHNPETRLMHKPIFQDFRKFSKKSLKFKIP